MSAESNTSRRPPRGALIALLLVLVAGPVGLALAPRHHATAHRARDLTLTAIAARSGCRLTQYDTLQRTNPSTGGSISNERFIARDGSYVGRRPPSDRATQHALMHGRVLIRYRPDLPAAQLAALDRFTREDPGQLVTFEDTTGLRPPVVVTAYLTMMTCPSVTPRTVAALRAFHDRRRAFGQTL